MIRTVFLSSDYPSDETIDNQINSWLAENPDIKLIDIKFQSNVSAVADSGVSAEYWHSSALIIYKVPSENNIRSIKSKRKDKKIIKTNYFHFGNNSKTNKPGILVKLRTRKRQ